MKGTTVAHEPTHVVIDLHKMNHLELFKKVMKG
jgi:hypothetical protein